LPETHIFNYNYVEYNIEQLYLASRRQPPTCEKTMSDISNDTALSSSVSLFSSWIEAEMAAADVPGAAVGIVHRDQLVWSAGFGVEDREQNKEATPQTLFRIASISKTFTATAIMHLYENGHLRLDDPVEKHLPWFRLENPFPDAPPPTINHLLSHTAGLPREAAFPYWNDFNFPDLDQLKAGLSRQAFAFAPGERFKYSNLGYALAGQIIEAVAGVSYAEYVEKNILSPLGMQHTHIFPTPDMPGLATGYSRQLPGDQRTATAFTDSRAVTPAANLCTCIEDLGRYLSFQLGHGPKDLLSLHTLRQMHHPIHVFENWDGGRSPGFAVYHRQGQTLVGHGGHVYGYRSQIIFDNQAGIGIAVLLNASGTDPLEYALQALRLITPALTADSPKSLPNFDPAWTAYLGKYRSPWADSEVKRLGQRLVLLSPQDNGLDGGLYDLIPRQDGSFYISGESGEGAVGEHALFETNKTGKVLRLKIGDTYTYPHKGAW
jgi:D-alanyl-D-alanine carboxypeptidase